MTNCIGAAVTVITFYFFLEELRYKRSESPAPQSVFTGVSFMVQARSFATVGEYGKQ